MGASQLSLIIGIRRRPINLARWLALRSQKKCDGTAFNWNNLSGCASASLQPTQGSSSVLGVRGDVVTTPSVD